MTVGRTKFTPVENNKSNMLQTQPKVEADNKPSNDEEKSNAMKYMIGATAVAGVIALGILGRRGNLGSKIQKFLGGTEKNVARETHVPTSTTSHIPEPNVKAPETPIQTPEQLAREQAEIERLVKEAEKESEELAKLEKQRIAESNARNEKWLEEQHIKKEQDYEKMWMTAEAEREAEFAQKLKLFETEVQGKSISELNNLEKINSTRIKELRNMAEEAEAKALGCPREYVQDLNKEYFTHEQKLEWDNLWEQQKLIRKQRLDAKDKLLEKSLVKNGDKEVKVPKCTNYLNSEEQEALGRYYDMYPHNRDLRAGEDAAKFRDCVLMDGALKKAPPLAEDAVVYRAVHGHPVFKNMQKFIASIKEGSIISDKAYISTSVRVNDAQFRQFAQQAMDEKYGGYLMRIKLPKGTKGVLGGYNEFVLPRNSQIKVNKIEIIDGQRIADCEYILP